MQTMKMVVYRCHGVNKKQLLVAAAMRGLWCGASNCDSADYGLDVNWGDYWKVTAVGRIALAGAARG